MKHFASAHKSTPNDVLPGIGNGAKAHCVLRYLDRANAIGMLKGFINPRKQNH